MRSKKALYNSAASMALQIVSMVCAFILPRLIMTYFGSSYNGITASISQFISVIALLRAGIGGVTRAALYKSLAKRDYDEISSIVKATEIFMRKISLIFLGGMFIFACFYPMLVKDEFSWLFSFSLVVIISISTFVQYYFGITYQMLLQADQRQYIYSILQIVTTALNTLTAAILIKCGMGIHGIKLGSSLVFCITPVFLNIYSRKAYHIDHHAKPDFSAIKQRWDAFFHQLSSFIHNNTDVVLLTIFTSTKEISVYTVYYLVAHGVRNVIFTIASGIEAAYGNMIANGEEDSLKNGVKMYETIMHFIVCVVFSVSMVLITPFVMVYTNGITDVNYERRLFGYIVMVSEIFYCTRSPYESVINAAGHFKQTKKYAFSEALINLVVSLVLVGKFGLVGVVIGTLVSILFRTIVYALYVKNHIVKGMTTFDLAKRYCISAANIAIIIILSGFMQLDGISTYSGWIINACALTAISAVITSAVNFLFYLQELKGILTRLLSITKRKVKARNNK